MPSLDVFHQQQKDYKDSVIPKNKAPVTVIEAGVDQGWYTLGAENLLFIGINRFGASAPAKILAEKFGLTGEQAAKKIRTWLSSLK